MNKVSVIIVNWNTKNYLDKCLHSLETNAGDRITLEIIVIDNNSSDESVTMVKERHPDIRLIENKNNVGFAKANNIGIEKASGDYILLLNPDTLVKQNSIKKLLQFLQNNQTYGAVGPKILNSDGTIQYECARNFPTVLSEFFVTSTIYKRFPANKFAGRYLITYWNHEDSRDVACISGACMLIRKRCFDSIGLLDESFFMYAEDTDFCYRLNKKGYSIRYVAESEIIHHWGKSSEQAPVNMSRESKESIFKFFRKHYGFLTAARYRAMICLASLFMIILSMFIIIFKRKKIQSKFFLIFTKQIEIFLWSINLR
jgi:hypothetical protein